MPFARDLRTGKLPLVNLIFCDESRFAMGPDNHWVWRRRGEYSEGVFAETNKYTKIPIRMWATIGSGFKFSHIIFAKNVDSNHCIDSLQKSEFFESADGKFGSRQWDLVQDRAPCHTSFRSLNALFELCDVFPEWPPNSHDLNLIESLWGAIKRRL
jgi:hypothetical protein